MSEHKVILDQIGRTVLGKVVSENSDTLVLDNPIIIHTQIDESGRIVKVDSYPILFFEFIDKNSRDTNTWTYRKSSIVVSDAILDSKILSQYEKINQPQDVVPVTKNPKIISIDDV
jgi:hypothetical protein